MQSILGTLTGLVLGLATSISQAQTYPVTAGEHADFTRVVVHAPPGVQWALTNLESEWSLAISPASAQFDLTRLFNRIPRTRLAQARSRPGELLLTVPCACTANAWEERPGLIVIDIRESQSASRAATAMTEPLPSMAPQQTTEAARTAGALLAQAHVTEALRATPRAPDETSLQTEGMLQSLSMPIAQALGQGLLEPAVPGSGEGPVLLMPDTTFDTAVPENMQVSNAVGRPAAGRVPVAQPPEACQGADAMAFLRVETTEPFDVAFGRLTRSLYGEFDQPDPETRRDLIELYLSAGFGAEARALIENEPDPVSGREPLLGMSDVFEDRMSNSRMRVARMIECDGVAAVFAVLAGAPASSVRQAATQVALVFTEMSAQIRAMLGPALARHLIEADALDAARVVIGSARRSSWSSASALDVLEALLDRARGQLSQASSRLEFSQGSDLEAVQARLDLALETSRVVSPTDLADAEALASTLRGDASGSELMSAIIRLRAQSGDFSNGFSALDRLANWTSGSSVAEARVAELHDVLWTALAQSTDDMGLMQQILDRDEWRDPRRSLDARLAMARRLLQLGLGAQVLALLPDTQGPESAELVAAALVLQRDPRAAIDVLGNLDSESARRTRAEAMAALGLNDSASLEFESIQDTEDARNAAIMAQDWTRVQRLSTAPASSPDQRPPVDLETLGRVIERAPGYLDAAPVNARIPAASTGIGQPGSPSMAQVSAQGVGPNVQSTSQSAPESRTAQPSDGVAPPASPPPGQDMETAASTPRLAEPFDFDRLGLITRSATLLDESARLRNALAPLAVGR